MRVLATTIVSLFFMGSALAATIVPRDVSYLTAHSDLIVRGHVTAQTVKVDDQGRAWTHNTIKVAERWKGAPEATIDIVQLGGPLPDGRVMYIDGDLALSVGMDIVIFASERDGQLFSTLLGWSAFEVEPGLTITRHQQHFGFFSPDKTGRMNDASPPTTIAPTTLIDLKSRVRRALGGGK
jgi:hypothetical protein